MVDRRGRGVWAVVPTLNEAAHIHQLLERIRREMVSTPCHVCIVDDGSLDGTVELARAFPKNMARSTRNSKMFMHIIQREKTHRGSQRGGAVLAGYRYGLERSDCDVFVEMDADLSHRPDELMTGIRAIRELGYEVAIASKYLRGSRIVDRPWTRRLLSFTYNWVLRRFISLKVNDYSNGYRFYQRRIVEIICKENSKYGSPIWLSEVLAILLARGAKVFEFPTTYVGRNEGVSKLRWTDIAKAGVGVVDISLRYHLGLLSPSSGASFEQP